MLEPQLERLPWARLSDQRTSGTIEVQTTEPGREGSWMVVSEHDRLPGPFDADLYVAVGNLYNVAGAPESGTVTFSFYDLAQAMRRVPSGQLYRSIEDSLTRLSTVTIRARNLWREGATLRRRKDAYFHLVERVEIDQDLRGAVEVRTASVTFSPTVLQALKKSYRLLNVVQYFGFDLPTTKRLYRYLDYRRHRGSEAQARMKLPLKQLAVELPLAKHAPSDVKAALEDAHHELLDAGFLRAVQYEELAVPGRKRPEHFVIYHFGTGTPAEVPAPVTAPVTALPTTVPVIEPTDELVKRCVPLLLRYLKPENRDVGWYVKVVKTLPDVVVEHLVGQAKELSEEIARGETSAETARKLWAGSAKRRAAESGVSL